MTSHKHTLIDCGSNLGQGFELLRSKHNIDASWKVYMFEPNPYCFSELQKRYKNQSNIIIENKAICSHSDEVKFYITTSLDGIIDKHSDGSKVGDVLNLFTGRSHLYGYADPINTGAVRLSDLINQIDCTDNLVVKLDIEGSEYSVLLDLIETESIKKIDSLYVEFHNSFIDGDKRKEFDRQRDDILLYIKNTDIQFTEWH